MAELASFTGVRRHFTTGGGRVSPLRGVDFQLGEGEMVVVMGRSGSGKTTLLSLAGGLDFPDEGRVVVAGQDVGELRGEALDRFRRDTVGWMFQTSGLLPLLTAVENVALALRLQGCTEEASDTAAAAALEQVGLEARAHHRSYELSGGEQQRVALARALVKKPRLLLADEPTGQLDTETARGIIALMRSVPDRRASVLVATHDEGLAELADRVLQLRDGQLHVVARNGR
jgi:putative ABC transport system ATP-binding protein